MNKKAALEESPFNKVLLPTQGIEVVCRIRPQFNSETYVSYRIEEKRLDLIEVGNDREIQNQKQFQFTEIYDQHTESLTIFRQSLLPMLKDCFEKRKGALVFTYGVTNSGKTHTVVGNKYNQGLLPLTLETLARIRSEFKKANEPTINGEPLKMGITSLPEYKLHDIQYNFQALEIYNEELYDLLPDKSFTKSKLAIKEQVDKKQVVKDALDHPVESQQDFEKFYEKALSNRKMGETMLNINSSRSHTIFRVTINQIFQHNGMFIEKKSHVCIVDLAGSERAKKAETHGTQLTEACNINKSLLVLGKCLSKMRNNEDHKQIPWRECKLTRLLCEYFTDDNRILMIINVQLTKEDIDETLKVLHYGALSHQVNLLKSKVYEPTIAFQQHNKNLLKSNNNELSGFKQIHILQNDDEENWQDEVIDTRHISRGQLKRVQQFLENTERNIRFQADLELQMLHRKMFRVKQGYETRIQVNEQPNPLENNLVHDNQFINQQQLKNIIEKIQNDQNEVLEGQEEEIPFDKNAIYDEQPLDLQETNNSSYINQNTSIQQQQISINDDENKIIDEIVIQENYVQDEQQPEVEPMEIKNFWDQQNHSPILINEQSARQLQFEQEPIFDTSAFEAKQLQVEQMPILDIPAPEAQPLQEVLQSPPRQKCAATNTTPFDEMKDKLFINMIGFNRDHQQFNTLYSQQQRNDFKDYLIKNLFKDEEPIEEVIEQPEKNIVYDEPFDKENVSKAGNLLVIKNGTPNPLTFLKYQQSENQLNIIHEAPESMEKQSIVPIGQRVEKIQGKPKKNQANNKKPNVPKKRKGKH